MDAFAVVGDPVAQSKSPEIHRAFAEQAGFEQRYDKIRVMAGQLQGFVQDFKRAGLGLNVTVPLKLEAFALADELDAYARSAGAVNTLKFEPYGDAVRVMGFNTDGLGLVRDLTARFGVDLAGKHVMLLGAGGAGQGVLLPLLEAGVGHLTLANRTLGKAQSLLEALGPRYQAITSSVALDAPLDCDVVINATSLGLESQALPFAREITRGAICYDMSYGPQARFARWAEETGALQALDGLGMLVEQAAFSFKHWRGVEVATEPVYQQLRAALDAR